jgi:hypothetical protein
MRLTMHHKDTPNAVWDVLAFDPANHNMLLRGGHSLQQLIMRTVDLKTAGFVITQVEGTRDLWYHPESDSYVEDFENGILNNAGRDPLLEQVTGIFDHEARYFILGIYVDELRQETSAEFDQITKEAPIDAPAGVPVPADMVAGMAVLEEQAEP